MTVNKGDKVLITETAWKGAVAEVIEVLHNGNLRVIRDEDPNRQVGILMKSEWTPWVEPVEPELSQLDRIERKLDYLLVTQSGVRMQKDGTFETAPGYRVQTIRNVDWEV